MLGILCVSDVPKVQLGCCATAVKREQYEMSEAAFLDFGVWPQCVPNLLYLRCKPLAVDCFQAYFFALTNILHFYFTVDFLKTVQSDETNSCLESVDFWR